MQHNFKANTLRQKLLTALIVTFGGFVAINLTFVLAGLFGGITSLIVPNSWETEQSWFPPVQLGFMYLVLMFASWKILHSGLRTLYKAVFLPTPLAATYLVIGVSTYKVPAVGWVLAVLFGLGVLTYLIRTRRPWPYFYAMAAISVTMAAMGIAGTEI